MNSRSLVPRRLLAVLGSVLVGFGLAACNSDVPSSSGDANPARVSMGTQAWIGYGPWHIVKEKGFDKNHGIDLDLVNFNTDADLSSAFAAGRLQAGNAATNTVAQFLKAGQPRTIVLFEDTSRTADAILARPDIRSVADLRGKKVAFEEGTTSDILLRHALSTAGLGMDDIKVVPTPASDAGSALISGGVDAAVTYEPYISALRRQDSEVAPIFTAGDKPGLISDTLTVNTEWAKKNPAVVSDLLLAWNDAVMYYREHKQEAQAIIAKGVGVDVADLTTSFDGVDFYDLQQSNTYLTKEFPETASVIEKVLSSTADESASGVSIAGAVDTSYGAKAGGAN
ncbi:ABC transporter substrate-binding protein [Actinoplanes sp. NEAU-A12]|uniref:ABC transporter substrate-binding protein n=1 Tax=Actinoplanes sandaracinus TaxID=3045177 RepID=A0ABT6WX45_9ACTN|nr:ABC transporter substrate-binding protein [Actinoplanes sandaracinus]MDI6104312.1 ABC transporter substrate-binding protein [Actinoplanes sandaracinus]